MKYVLYLGMGCQIVDAVLNMRREAAQAGQHGLVSLTSLNKRLGLGQREETKSQVRNSR